MKDWLQILEQIKQICTLATNPFHGRIKVKENSDVCSPTCLISNGEILKSMNTLI